MKASDMKNLHGIIPYLPSPVDAEGRIATAVLSRLCIDLIEDGVHGLCVLGSAGEFAYLTFEQKIALVECVVAASAGRVPVIAGVYGASVAQASREAFAFSALGIDGIVVLLQTYFPLTGTEMALFYRGVAETVTHLPVVVYTNPKYMHFDVTIPVFELLAEVPNILYVKDASGNTGKLLSMVNHFGNRFSLFSASAHVPLFVLELGGVGWMAGPACLVPRQSVLLYELHQAGNHDDALALQMRLWEMNRTFVKYDLVACVKAGLEHLGYAVGNPIMPLAPLGGAERAEVCTVVDALRALGS
jgi:4-hydroxy-tetrahydrodipicolinate synthase